MDKRKLSAISREPAPEAAIRKAMEADMLRHVVTARLVEEEILLLNFYEVSGLKTGKTEAAFRTYLSKNDYITQDLKTSKVKWKTASFYMMEGFSLFKVHWNQDMKEYEYPCLVDTATDGDRDRISEFFRDYLSPGHRYDPWTAIYDFQKKVMSDRLMAQYKKETDPIDNLMSAVGEVPGDFIKWSFEEALGFSRYLIYKGTAKGNAQCVCTYCGKSGLVDREKIRLRNNEKGSCPFCGSPVTFKAEGRMPAQILDERWTIYVDRTKEGFIWRAFRAYRSIRKATTLAKYQVTQGIREYQRSFYMFVSKDVKRDSYEYAEYRQSGKTRWCHNEGKTYSGLSILYPGNLPQAWEHTPMKWSALEILSRNLPTVAMKYESGIRTYLQYPVLEWLIKMGLNRIAEGLMDGTSSGATGRLFLKKKSIFQILGLDKPNTRILQQIDGNYDELRLLQVAQSIGLQIKAEQLRGYYETFGCNTELLKQSGRKVSLYKLVKYITKESENYPIGEEGQCWRYSYMRYQERTDPRIERRRNTAKDWLEYLGWCKELKYDLNNRFIYMPTKFKKVHDRTAKEYQAYKDEQMRKRKAAIEKRVRGALAEAAELPAMQMRANGLIIITPKSGDEIRQEGIALHHCVGTYVEAVAQRKTLILFIRKESQPDTPYFTAEYRNGKIIQCRGKNNCGMPKEVQVFVKAFERKMQSEEKTINDSRKAG